MPVLPPVVLLAASVTGAGLAPARTIYLIDRTTPKLEYNQEPAFPINTMAPFPIDTTPHWMDTHYWTEVTYFNFFAGLHHRKLPTFSVHGCPPAPRLVCVETNPGPNPSGVAKLLGAIGNSMGAAVAKTKKKKALAKTKKKKSTRSSANGSMLGASASSMAMSVPTSSQMQTSVRYKTGSFQVPFSSAIAQVFTTSNSAAYVSTVGLPVTTSLGNQIATISPFVTTSTAYAPIAFPNQIARLATSFSQYRMKPGTASLSYRTVVGSSTAGSVAISALPADLATQGSTIPFNTVAGAECSITTPVWAAETMFNNRSLESVMVRDQNSGWHYCDFDGTISQPEARQDSLCLIAVAGLGLPASTVCGLLYLEGVLEFKHLQDNYTEVNVSTAVVPTAAVEEEKWVVANDAARPSHPPSTLQVNTTAPSGWFGPRPQ
jgi:hypothetical protein